jgi:hypothetical protein
MHSLEGIETSAQQMLGKLLGGDKPGKQASAEGGECVKGKSGVR